MKIMGNFIFTLIYIFIFLPIGLILRVFKIELLDINFNKTVSSYWQKKD